MDYLNIISKQFLPCPQACRAVTTIPSFYACCVLHHEIFYNCSYMVLFIPDFEISFLISASTVTAISENCETTFEFPTVVLHHYGILHHYEILHHHGILHHYVKCLSDFVPFLVLCLFHIMPCT